MWNAWGIAWGDSWGTSWGPLHEVEDISLGGRDKLKRRDVQSRVVAALSVKDDSDTLAATVYCARSAAWLHEADLDDVLQAVAAVAWPQARLVIESVRLLRAPAAPKMVRQMALIRDN